MAFAKRQVAGGLAKHRPSPLRPEILVPFNPPVAEPNFWDPPRGGIQMEVTDMSQSLNLTSEQVERTKALRKDGQTPNELMEQIYNLGLYQLEYRQGDVAQAARKAYRQKRQAEDKVARELLKKAQSDPDLAVKLGLGTRQAL